MPVTTPGPFHDAALQLPPGRCVQGFARAHRPRGIVVAYAIGLVLLVPSTTSALELGEASIKSGLGESLVVEIPYRLAGNERVTSACIGIAPEHAADGLPTYSRVSRISITSTHIEIFDERSVLEPLISLNVDVHCNDAPHFVRSYQLFVDPPAHTPTILSNGSELAAAQKHSAIGAAAPVAARPSDATAAIPNEIATTAATTDPTASTATPRTARANASPRARGLAGGNLPQGQTYRVVRGDTLSGIAARIAGRPLTIGQTADAIFAANPAAFTRGNPDLIEEGRSITIPNMTLSAALAAPSTPAPADRAAELSDAAPVAALNPAPAPPNVAQSVRADDASVAVADAAQPLPATVPVVSQPSAVPVAAPTRAEGVPEVPSAATRSVSAWLVPLLAVGIVILLWASLAFVRRRRKQPAATQVGTKVQEPPRRRPAELASRMGVVESRLPAPSEAATLSMRRMEIAPVDSGAALAADLKNLALTIGPTDPVDFNVGAPVATTERVDGFADRAPVIDIGAVGDDTVEENAATTRMPDIDDEKLTMTIVELDMLRQDYEAEHTLTQQSSQALRDAVADLAATKAARAATAETSTLESPRVSQAETSDGATEAPTARLRVK